MKEILPKVSIIIPVYNGTNFLRESIESALAQTYDNLEVIVVNDGSTDNGATENIALSYGKKIDYYTKKNGGVASALNFGIEKMKGDFFSWLSHDDLYEPTKIQDEVECLLSQANPNQTIIACNSVALFNNGVKKKDRINKKIFDNYFDLFLATSARTGLNGCTLLIPRTSLIESGGFKNDLPVTQDYDLWFRLKDNNRFILLEKHLVIYRHHELQDSAQKAQLCLMSGDELRANMLKKVPDQYFSDFMANHKGSKMWILDNYNTYIKWGYIKTPLMILRHILKYYYLENPVQYKQIISNQKIINKDKDTQIIDVIKEIDRKVSETSKEIHNTGTHSDNKRSKVSGYIESIRNDGVGFMIQKAFRKIMNILRKS